MQLAFARIVPTVRPSGPRMSACLQRQTSQQRAGRCRVPDRVTACPERMKISRPDDASGVDIQRAELHAPALYSHGDPHLVWHALRERAPVSWQVMGAHGFWAVTRYEDVNRVLRDHEAFTSERGTMLGVLGANDPAARSEMTVTDPPRHTRMRVPLQRLFTPRALQSLAPRIEVEVEALLGPARDGAPFDLAAAAMTLSATVAMLLLGVDVVDRARLARLAVTAVAPDDPEYKRPGGRSVTLAATHRELFAYFYAVAVARRRAPRDDFVSILTTLVVDDSPIDTEAVVANCYSMLLGSTVTTPHVLSAGVLELVESDFYAEWAARPDVVASLVEEALRWASPANHFMRHATRDVVLSGVTVAAGDPVVVWLGSANRDADVFTDPYRFDPCRDPNRHIAFGAGPHHCLGHAVARLTLQIAFAAIFRQLAAIEINGPVEHLHSNFIAGIKHLPVRARAR